MAAWSKCWQPPKAASELSGTVYGRSRSRSDLLRLYEFILAKDQADCSLPTRALEAIKNGIRGLELSPFSYRKATPDNPFLRELIIPFGASGYVALFEIDNDQTVTILAVRHQLEEGYH